MFDSINETLHCCKCLLQQFLLWNGCAPLFVVVVSERLEHIAIYYTVSLIQL